MTVLIYAGCGALGTAAGLVCAAKIDSLRREVLTPEENKRIEETLSRYDCVPDPVIVVDDSDTVDEVEENVESLDGITSGEKDQIIREVERIVNGEPA